MFKPETIKGFADEIKSLNKENFTTWFNYCRANKKPIPPAAWSLASEYKIPMSGPVAEKAMEPFLYACSCDSRDLAFFGHDKNCKYKKSLKS